MGLPVCGSGAIEVLLETSRRLNLRSMKIDLGNENMN